MHAIFSFAADYNEDQTPAWRTVLPDPLTSEYISAMPISTMAEATYANNALVRCSIDRNTLQVNLSPLFWSTQSKDQQIHFRRLIRTYGEVTMHDKEHSLCFKCNRWVPNEHLARHLPLEELKRFHVSHPATSYLVPDSSETCRICAIAPNSRVESNDWYLHYLQEPDWPSFCKTCRTMVMHSSLKVHRSNPRFYAHATMARLTSFGILTKTRFSHYPGRPSSHLFFVGRWNICGLLKLAKHDHRVISQALMDFTCARGIIAWCKPVDLCTPAILVILSFLPDPFQVRHTPILEELLELCLGDKEEVAKRVLLLYVRQLGNRKLSDRFGMSQ